MHVQRTRGIRSSSGLSDITRALSTTAVRWSRWSEYSGAYQLVRYQYHYVEPIVPELHVRYEDL